MTTIMTTILIIQKLYVICLYIVMAISCKRSPGWKASNQAKIMNMITVIANNNDYFNKLLNFVVS